MRLLQSWNGLAVRWKIERINPNMEQDRKNSGRRHGERKEKTARRTLEGTRPSATNPRLRDAVVSLDAEDIALARLQAHLRRAEAIHSAVLPGATAPRRTTLRLPVVLLARLRERAKRDGVTVSEVVEQALDRFLRSR